MWMKKNIQENVSAQSGYSVNAGTYPVTFTSYNTYSIVATAENAGVEHGTLTPVVVNQYSSYAQIRVGNWSSKTRVLYYLRVLAMGY